MVGVVVTLAPDCGASSATSVAGASGDEGVGSAPRAKAGARRRKVQADASAAQEDTREALTKRLVETQKELLRLQMGAKARQLEQLRSRLHFGRGTATKSSTAARTRQPGTVTREKVVVAASSPGKTEAAQTVTVVGSASAAPLPTASSASPAIAAAAVATPLKRTLESIAQQHTEKVEEQRRMLEAAFARRQELAAAAASNNAASPGGTSVRPEADINVWALRPEMVTRPQEALSDVVVLDGSSPPAARRNGYQ